MVDNRHMATVFLILLIFSAVLYGDGCFVWKGGADLEEPTQRAIIYWQNGREVLILQVKYAGAAEDFAWIVPLPGRPEVDAIDVDKSPFEELSFYTQWRRRWGYIGRAAAGKEGVTVIERKVVGVYDVAVLAASDPNALNKWLNDNGYAFPEKRSDVLQHYTSKKWVYVAMRIDRKALQSDEVKKLKTGELQSIRFRFAAKEMVYPLKISSVNSGQTEVLLYVLADAPMVARGKHKRAGLSIEENICWFPRYQDAEFGTYSKARGEELPLTWEALGVPKDKGLSLCKYRAVYKTVEMTNDLVFERFEPIPYWREQLGEREGKAGYRRHHAVALSVLGYHDAELLKKLAKDADAGMRAVAAVNPRTPRELLLELARDKDVSVRRDVAQNIRAPGYLLAVLAKDQDRDVKRYIVWNPNTPAEVLQTLAEDSSSQIRTAVAWSRRASVDLLGRLARDKDAKVREAVAGNSNASGGTARALAEDPDAAVRARVASRGDIAAELLGKLARDRDERVRGDVAVNQKTSVEILVMLAGDESSRVRSRVVRNSNLPNEALEELAGDKNPDVRKAVALNQNASAETLGVLARDQIADVRYNVAYNPKTPVDVLVRLASDSDKSVRARAAGNERTPPEVLSQMASDEDVEVRRGVSYNPNTFEEALRRLAKDAGDWVRCGVAHNRNTSPEVLRKLAKDGSRYVRSAVATNPNTPEDVLRMLAQDEEWHVSSSAKRALEKRGVESR
jgi:ethanolamine utilization microcompartment shell protein EutL